MDSTRVDPEADDTFDELLSEIARAPGADLLPPGAQVGEYDVVAVLGRGTFGVVYHATHRVIGKQVALKVLSAMFANDPAMVARFVDEARAVNRIDHPNIVDIFGFGSLSDGRKYCVMELLQGETLGSCLERRGRLPLVEALPILAQIAAALDAAHASGVVHRDLKPDNIFLLSGASTSEAGSGPKVKLLDFGIAQIADGVHQRTGSHLTLGTPAYMSPEQCEGIRVDHRSDIYALGLVAFKLLTGQLPFRGSNAVQMALLQVSAVVPAPSTAAPELPASVDSAVLRMLEKRPDARPSDASTAIRALLEGSSVSAADARPAPLRESRTAQGRAAGVLLVVVALLAALYLLRGARSGDNSSVAPATGSSASSQSEAATTAASGRTSPAPPATSSVSGTPSAERRNTGGRPNVSLRVEGYPASAKLFVGSREVGQVGQRLELPWSEAPINLTARAPGYVRREMRLVPDRDQVVEIRLSPAAARANPELEY